MRISPADLAAQYDHASAQWPFITTIGTQYRLPVMLLFAVASRETNMTNEIGDGGHGHGVFQLDDRSHTIPAGFDSDVQAQCSYAAGMLAALITRNAGSLRRALAAYNAGQGTVDYNVANGLNVDTGTAGGDYSADVVDRMLWLQQNRHATPTPSEEDMTPEQEAKLDTAIRLLRLVINGDPPGTAPADQHTYAESLAGLKADLNLLKGEVAAIKIHVGA